MYVGADKDFPADAPSAGGVTENAAQHKGVKEVQATFSREWDDFEYEAKNIWHWTVDERVLTFAEELRIDEPSTLRGALMIDAGCGSGILSMTLAQRFGIEIIALDMAFVVGRAFAQNRSNLCHFVQGSVLAPPLASGIADLTYSHGVLHHTYDTRKAFDAIAKLPKSDGLLYVWLYGRKAGWRAFRNLVLDIIRLPVSRLPRPLQTVAVYGLVSVHMLARAIKRVAGITVQPIASLRHFCFIIRDHYTPPYARTHREAEVVSWFESAGYRSEGRRRTWSHTDVWKGSEDLSMLGTRLRTSAGHTDAGSAAPRTTYIYS